MGRPPCCDKEGIKKGPWTPEEDIILVSYIQEHGPGNWRSVPINTGLMRCSKSCRLRWTNYLRPGIKRGNFTAHEEGSSSTSSRCSATAGPPSPPTSPAHRQRHQELLEHPPQEEARRRRQLHFSSLQPPPHLRRRHLPSAAGSYTVSSNSDVTQMAAIARRSPSPTAHPPPTPPAWINISKLLDGFMKTNSPSPPPPPLQHYDGGYYDDVKPAVDVVGNPCCRPSTACPAPTWTAASTFISSSAGVVVHGVRRLWRRLRRREQAAADEPGSGAAVID
ncbi:hypothetical protein EE612_053284 [Oryza sativa]|nr:hypothetical protein EE612_053284 [Oryza sativa]